MNVLATRRPETNNVLTLAQLADKHKGEENTDNMILDRKMFWNQVTNQCFKKVLISVGHLEVHVNPNNKVPYFL